MAQVTLREINKDNYMAIHKLSVKPEQQEFAATNAQSLSQSQRTFFKRGRKVSQPSIEGSSP